jgi:polyhydroxybutyrate depolymerase
MRPLFAVTVALVFAGFCSVGLADQLVIVPTPEGPRQAFVATAEKVGPSPTIIVLHGATVSAERMKRISGFAEAGAMHGFTVVFPEGKANRWNDARAKGDHPDDIGFLNALAHQLVVAQIADPHRLYIAGVSNGGLMAFTLICQPNTPFVGIATIVANLPANLEASCHPPKPLSVIMMNGTADPFMPFGGGRSGMFGRHGPVIGAEKTAELFAKSEDCAAPSEATLPKIDAQEATHIKLLNWQGCAPEAAVRLYEIEGGGHQIPGGPTFVPFLFGPPNHDIRAADEIITFFSHP